VLLHDYPLALTLAIDIRDAKRRIERFALVRRSRDALDAARVRDLAVGVDHQVVHLGDDWPLEHVEEALPGLLKRRGSDVLLRRHDIEGEHVIGVAAHDLLDVFCLDAVDEALFKCLDFRSIAGPGRYATPAGSDHNRDGDCRTNHQGSFHCRLSLRYASSVSLVLRANGH
jgi:hypothetical protein